MRTYIDGYTEWQTAPDICHCNRLPHRADFAHFASQSEAVSCDRLESSLNLSLNGKWKFRVFKNSSERADGFAEPKYNHAHWDTITVPSNWQLKGFDYPQYCGTQYPWEWKESVMPPYAPAQVNPVGCYARKFNIPSAWDGRRVVLRFEGVQSAFYLYINGERIGYSENSFAVSEFDITDYVRLGSNVVGVEVYRWCTGSWLEGQDSWRLSGIFRDVFLYSTHQIYIADIGIRADMDKDFKDGFLKVHVTTSGDAQGLVLEMSVRDAEGTIAGFDSAYIDESGDAFLRTTIGGIETWCAENPYLYTAIFTLRDTLGNLDFTSCKVGFRRIEIKDGILLLNGNRLVLKGVNYHAFSAKNAYSVTREELQEDAKHLKQNNLNAVITVNGPVDAYFYSLCDEYGIYVIDENNLDTHGTLDSKVYNSAQIPGDGAEWTPACMDRIESLYERNKNHACVIGWSLGRECGTGSNLIKMYEYLKNKDCYRFVLYSSDYGAAFNISDVYSKKSATVQELEQILIENKNQNKPFVLNEFKGSYGNSGGGIGCYTTLFHKYSNFQGFFIWSYIDRAIETKNKQDSDYLAYSGDFGDNADDGSLCASGLVFADRTPSPKLPEIKRLYQNVRFKAIDAERGLIEISNDYSKTNLSSFRLLWEQVCEGELLRSGEEFLNISPNETALLDLELNIICRAEWYLNLKLVTVGAPEWGQPEHIVAQEQFVLNHFKPEKRIPRSTSTLILNEDYGSINISCEEFDVRFSRRTGWLTSFIYKGTPLLDTPLMPNFWRAPTTADIRSLRSAYSAVWRLAGTLSTAKIDSYHLEPGAVIVKTSFIAATQPFSVGTIEYTVTRAGIKVNFSFTPDERLPEIPEVGLCFNTKKRFRSLEYLGRGPYENYIDRNSAADIGLYKLSIDDLFVPYLIPQENGERTEVRYAKLVSRKFSLIIDAYPQMELNVGRWSAQELEVAGHAYDLPDSDKLTIRLIAKQAGVGDPQNCEADDTQNRSYSLSFALMPTEEEI